MEQDHYKFLLLKIFSVGYYSNQSFCRLSHEKIKLFDDMDDEGLRRSGPVHKNGRIALLSPDGRTHPRVGPDRCPHDGSWTGSRNPSAR